jgi:hypothetical protein
MKYAATLGALLVLLSPQVSRAQTVSPAPNCAQTSTGFMPLTDMGKRTYHGFPGGLYSHGTNVAPPSYLTLGMQHARRVQPLAPSGEPSGSGKIGLLSIGMSNTTMEWSAFMRALPGHINPHVVVVDGAEAGQDAETIQNADSPYWSFVSRRLQSSGITGNQVQAVWLKEAIARPKETFPRDARHLERDLRVIVGILTDRFPHLQLIYLSSRTYGGYAVSPLNPEPYAYQSGFAVKWLIGGQMKSASLRKPWLGWGPYLWTDGTKGRKDGLVWTCADVRADGTHPSVSGMRKVGKALSAFFTGDKTATDWFLAQ